MGSAMGGLGGMSNTAKSGDLYGGNNAVSFGSFFGDSKTSAAGTSDTGVNMSTWLTVASVAVGLVSLWYHMRRKS